LVARNDGGQDRLGPVVEEHLAHPEAEGQQPQHPDLHVPERGDHCEATHEHTSAQIGDDQHLATIDPVDDDADGKREQHPGDRGKGGDEADRQRAVGDTCGQQRQRDDEHTITEVGDGCCEPQPPVRAG